MTREFVADLVKELFEVGNFNHLDGYGGALLALDLDEAMEGLQKKGWKISKEGSDDR